MPAKAKLTDEALRIFLQVNTPAADIAKQVGISEAAVSQRIKAFHRKAEEAAKLPQNVTLAHSTLWNTKEAAEANYQRALDLLEECTEPGEKTRVIAEIRQHLQFAMSVLETLYTVQETQAFMDEVMAVLDECEPGTRAKILTRLAEKRSVRAALFQSPK